MSIGLAWLASFLLLPVVGLPLLSHAAFRNLSPASRLVLAGGVGAVLVSFAMTSFALFSLTWNVPALTVAAVLPAFGLRWCLRGAGAAKAPAEGPLGVAGGLACAIALLAVLAAFAATSGGAAGSPDLVFFWGAKAQQFAAVRTIDAGFLGDAVYQYTHPDYPPLVPNLYAFATMIAGRLPWTAAMLTFPLVLGALALGLPGVLRGAAARPAASAASALIVAAIAYLGMEADIGGNAEMPLLFFETLGLGLLLSASVPGAAVELVAGLLLAGAASVKTEGLPFVLATGVLFLVVRSGARRAASALRLLGPAALALAAWFAFGATRKIFFGYSGYGRLLELHFEHGRVVLASTARSLASTGYGLPYLVPILCLVFALPLARTSLIPLGTAAALAGFLLFTYLHGAEDPAQWISWSAARVFAPLAVLAALASTCARERVSATEGARTTRASPR